jgi:hypothetical protein
VILCKVCVLETLVHFWVSLEEENSHPLLAVQGWGELEL